MTVPTIPTRAILGLLLSGLFAAGANAAPLRLEDAAGKAVQNNPEVVNKWHQFKSSLEETDISWGRYLPTLDVLFGHGRERKDSPLYSPPGERNYSFATSKTTLKWNLFEGFATQNDVERLKHASMVRFYEMLDLSETAAFEAAKAYIDVWRYRQLVSFAEENYATHRIIYEKISERAKTGVGRKVDLETAAGRLALAEANLLTETSNLHDVIARYQRVVGSVPPDEIAPPSADLLMAGFPKDRPAALAFSFDKSPQLKAAQENVLSANLNTDVQKGGLYPRLDAYAENGRDTNSGGFAGYTRTNTVGVTVSWNLFNGWRDKAREQKSAEDTNAAKDTREKVCRDIRQNAAMSFNDHVRLSEQLQYLDQHQLSSDKAREAFRRQFDIGQRTLLDVLDTENEYYTARRNYLNGEQDLLIAHAKYQAVAGNLLNVLKLKNLDMEPPLTLAKAEITCPAEAIELPVVDKEGIFKRAQAREELLRGQAPAVPETPAVPRK